jgi:hypothetical protein
VVNVARNFACRRFRSARCRMSKKLISNLDRMNKVYKMS